MTRPGGEGMGPAKSANRELFDRNVRPRVTGNVHDTTQSEGAPLVTDSSPTPGQGTEPPEIDTSVPHSARVWNYWLGGKDNFPVDRAAGDQFREIFPEIVDAARASRGFLTQAVRYLAGEAGIRQFLDVGTGLPTVDNTHEVAQRVAPDSRIVYVDNDPLVLVHARALLTSTPQGVTDYIDADLRDPDKILEAAANTLDFAQPVALILMGIVGHVSDYDEARSIVTRLLDALPSGSYLALDDGTNVINKAVVEEAKNVTTRAARSRTTPAALRRSPASSRGWSSWSPAWCRVDGGGPIPPTSTVAFPRRWTCSAV